jgi:hypothetical protein
MRIFAVLTCIVSLAVTRAVAYELPLAEIREMAFLCQTMNGAGKDDPPTDLNLEEPKSLGWDLWKEGRDPTNKAYYGGFNRYGNRWAIFKKGNTNTYAIVVRGTVFGQNLKNRILQRSWLEDALALTVKAHNVWFVYNGKRHAIQLSRNENSAVHIGFAYGLIDVLFHKKLPQESVEGGLVAVLRTLPDDSTIYITGHSQGAAIASLLHAFLHNRATTTNAYFGLDKKHFKLKSYVFAQPKPGDWQFAMDFSRGLYAGGMDEVSYVINNANDVVPQIPFSIQWLTQGPDGLLNALQSTAADQSKSSLNAVSGLNIAIALSKTFSQTLSNTKS